MTLSTESPCVGICSTVYGDDFCRGCKRTYMEIIEWNRYSLAKKQCVNQHLQQQLEAVAKDFLVILNKEKLKSQLDPIIIRPLIYASPLYWAYELLRLRATQIQDIGDYGLQAKPPYHTLTANGLFTQMDDRLYQLAKCAKVVK